MVASLKDLGATPSELPPVSNITYSPVDAIRETVEEVAFNTNEVRELSRESLDFLAGLALPTVYQFEFPHVLLSVWNWLLANTSQQRIFPQLALGLPRGFAKTTVIKLYILYCILHTKKKFILVTSSSSTLAENILSDVIDMLEEPNVRKTFGDWRLGVEKDTQQVKKFGYCGRNIILVALGAGSSLRGLNLKNERPDVMIFDDIQSKECADSQTQAEALETWMYGTAMKAKSPFGCVYIFVGNMYATKYSILKKLKQNPNWTKFICGAILADGSSLWEDLHPISQLLREYENDRSSGHPEIFRAEVLNDDTATLNNRIDLNALPPLPISDGDIAAGSFLVIDPATDKENSDAVSIGYFEIHNAVPILMDLVEGRFSPGETIDKALEFCFRYGCYVVAIESNAYQYSLNYWFNYKTAQMGVVGIHPVEVYSGVKAKNVRILNMFLGYAKGELFVHPRCKDAVHSQILDFNPLKTNNTDGLLDLLTYAPKVIEDFGDFICSLGVINYQQLQQTTVMSELENSPF